MIVPLYRISPRVVRERIEVFLTLQGWQIRFIGGEGERLHGKDDVPSTFGVSSPAFHVMAELARFHTDAEIILIPAPHSILLPTQT